MDLISSQPFSRKRCASLSLEDSILVHQSKKSCSSEFNYYEKSSYYESLGTIASLAKKVISQPKEEEMDCFDSNTQSENKACISNKHAQPTASCKHVPKQQPEKLITNLYVASSYRRSPVRCSRCCAGEPGHFNHLKS